MFIAVTRGGTGLPPAFGKEGGEGRAGAAPTVPAGGEGWAPRAACPCRSPPSPCHCQPRRPSPPAVVTSRGMGSNTGCDCLSLERQLAPSCQPGTHRGCPLAGQLLHQHRALPGRSSTVARRCPWRIPAGSGHRDAVPVPGMLCPSPGGASPGPGGAGCQEGCAIQFALISPSVSGSHAHKLINAGAAGGGGEPAPRDPPLGEAAERRHPEPAAARPGATGRGQAPGGGCVGPSPRLCCQRCHRALAALSIRRTGAPAAPKKPRDKSVRDCAPALPSHGLCPC